MEQCFVCHNFPSEGQCIPRIVPANTSDEEEHTEYYDYWCKSCWDIIKPGGTDPFVLISSYGREWIDSDDIIAHVRRHLKYNAAPPVDLYRLIETNDNNFVRWKHNNRFRS